MRCVTAAAIARPHGSRTDDTGQGHRRNRLHRVLRLAMNGDDLSRQRIGDRNRRKKFMRQLRRGIRVEIIRHRHRHFQRHNLHGVHATPVHRQDAPQTPGKIVIGHAVR